MDASPHFFELDLSDLTALVSQWAMPAFRARQIMEWVYRRGLVDPLAMTNLSQRHRQVLRDHLTFESLQVARCQQASDGTRKLLLQIPPGAQYTECVEIPATNKLGRTRRTACISSQVGCPVGCRFCASGLGGLERNLSAGQIVEQVWRLNHTRDDSSAAAGDGRISHIVFMGMGEPLSNFENVTRAIAILTAPWGLNISGRRITVSTVGLPAQIRRLASIDVPLTLAISLHAPNDDLRRQLIPWAQHTSIEAIIDAARHYFEHTGREVTLEYILLGHVNDRPEHARQLAAVAQRIRGGVNLIRYNEVRDLPFNRPTTPDVLRFREILAERGVNVHIRASRGRDIAAACGQLRHETRPAAATNG